MTADIELRPAEDFGDLLDLLAAHPAVVHMDDRDRVRAAIIADGKAHDGTVNSNRVRDALTNPSGELDVWHKSVGPQYSALKSAGLIEEAPPIRSKDQRGRNAGRWIPTYKLTEAGWSS